uniref:protein disulfide-isomerase n=1 Tax=Latimeria chalumnae TaxID=7897 RepID=H3ACC4_LATCH
TNCTLAPLNRFVTDKLFILTVVAFVAVGPVESKMGEKSAAKSQKSPPSKIKEEENVLVLRKSNFEKALKESKYLLVQFYLPFSGLSQILEEFVKAAGQLKQEDSEVQFGKVDAKQEKELGKEFQIMDFPAFKFFAEGDRKNPVDCKGVRTASAFLTWIRRRTGSSADVVDSIEQAISFTNSADKTILGFFKDLQGGPVEIFYGAAKEIPDLPFGVTDNQKVFKNYSITKNTLTLFKKFSEGKLTRHDLTVENTLKRLDLIRFIRSFEMDLVTEYNRETSVKIFDVPVDSHVVLFAAKSSKEFAELYENFRTVAAEHRGKILFIFVDTDETRNGRVFEYFLIRDFNPPAVRILNVTSDVRYRMPADEVTLGNLRSFSQSYLQGKAKPQTHSEEIPLGWDKKPVKVLVGQNFDWVVFNKYRNVFVMFYAPWSRECQDLLPVWDELGKIYDDQNNITIAKIDCTANEIESVILERHPTFKYFPAGSDKRIVHYTDAKTLEAFSEFLERNIQVLEPNKK